MKGKKRKLSKILKRNGYKPSDAIYIGDEVRDVLACKAISLEVIAVTWGFETKSILEKSNPNYIVDSVDELSELLLDEHEN
jgi:phosphoglycolate phosphatase